MNKVLIAFVFLCAACADTGAGSSAPPVHGSGFIYNQDAKPVEASAFIYNPDAPVVTASAFSY